MILTRGWVGVISPYEQNPRVKNDNKRGPFLHKNNDSRMKSLGEETLSCHCYISLVYQYMESLGISSGFDRKNVSTKELCKTKK